jgi:chromosome segregation ATPase
MELPAWAQSLVLVLGSGGVVGVAGKALGWWSGRESRSVKALTDTVTTLSEQLTAADDRQDRFGQRLDRAEQDLADCHEAHKRCEEGRAEDRRQIERQARQIEALQASLTPQTPSNVRKLRGAAS